MENKNISIEYVSAKSLLAADYNPRIMPDAEMQALKKSILQFGIIDPVVVNRHSCAECGERNVVVGGHQRRQAVIELFEAGKLTSDAIPVVAVTLHKDEEKALNLALNKISGEWNEKLLTSVIRDLKATEVIAASGFREEEISRILDSELDEAIDTTDKEVADIEIPESKVGEVYELGRHRLICGDATDPSVYDRLLNGEKADMIWTDPPYNVAYKSRGDGLANEGKGSIMNDNMSDSSFNDFIGRVFNNIEKYIKLGGIYYICSGYGSYPIFYYELEKTKLHLSSVIMWIKTGGQMAGWQEYHRRHEQIIKGERGDGKKAKAILYGWHNGDTHKFYGDFEYDVWEMPRKAAQTYLHPTEKPDWLPMRAMRNSTKRNDIVLDPFSGSGSGSVMAAAEKTGRRAYMIELDPKFCDVIRKRWAMIEKIEKAKASSIQ